MRKADANEVYKMCENLTYIFDRYRGWRDRTIFKFNAGDATKLTIELEGKKIALQTDAEGKWELLEYSVFFCKNFRVLRILIRNRR